MQDEKSAPTTEEEEFWRKALLCGEAMGRLRFWRRLMRVTPSAPRCSLCYNPFAGIGGRLLALAGFAPSRKNPRFCNT